MIKADARTQSTAAVRFALVAGIAASVACVVLMAARAWFVFATPEPPQALTSGAEFESLFAVWKAVHGRPVYIDQTRIPFAGSYYNWIYYTLYGGFARTVLGLLGLGDAWIPAVCKLFTLAGALGGLGLSWALASRVAPHSRPATAALGAAGFVLVFLGPLMGFWAIATAPDIWALTFDAASVLVFLHLYGRMPRRAVLAFAVLAYCAWGMKQVFVYSTGAVGLFLLSRRDWTGVFLLTAAMVSAWGATIAVGPPDYVRMVFFGGSQVILDPATAVRNMANFAVKCLPLLAGAAAAAAILGRRIGRHPELLLPALGIGVSAVMAGVASAKLGAAENYFFTTSFHLALFVWAALAHVRDLPPQVAWTVGLGWLGTGAAVTAVLAGLAGNVSMRSFHDNAVAAARCIGTRPGPVYVTSPALALPWLVPSEPAFVLHWNYPLDRAAGVAMEGGGVGGLIGSGYFATLIADPATIRIDGAEILEHYRQTAECGPLAVFSRRQEG
ncbi:hypothetical protein [Magnetospirillum sp. UT-4]|uniref:hypothetical protein n=1 Tax=Magnetospirillum sp. UT-4 TaxID=2681467 RepID=UPI00138646FE|nr:hypothetical protein [Magnetospirillum sp. UT-4]CAA7621657.1 membrane hypothetical protein [Magnetospirillum sp. UT-4]